MAYNKQTWKDEIPDLTKPIKDASGKQKMDPQTGRPLYELVQEGTRITSARLNHAEQGIEDAHILIEQLAKEWGGSFVAAPDGAAGFQFTASGLTASWTAGVGYVAGRRFDVAAGNLTLNPTQGQYIYLDTDGVIKRTTSQTTANAGLLLWYFATDASKVITSTDRRRTITPDSFVRRDEVVLKEQGKGLSTNDYSNEEKAKVQDHDQRLTVIEEEMGEAAPIPATLKPGIQTLTADRTTPFNVSGIKGRTLTNLLGRDGNCEDVSKWTVFSASTALDNVNKVQGDNGIKVTISNNYGTIQNIAPSTIKNSDSAYYVFLAEVKRLNCSKIDIAISDSYLGEQSTSTTNFSTLWTKVTGSFLSGKTLQVRFFGTNGQSGYVDAIRLYEITAAEYAALDSMTPEQIAAKYPYVDDVKPVRNPYAIRYGKNLLPPFTEWNLSSHSEVINMYAIKNKLDGNAIVPSHIFVNVIPGQKYTLSIGSITKTNINDNPRISYNFVNSDGTLRDALYGAEDKPIQITVPNDVTKIRFYLNNNGVISTNTYENPMLNIGDTALPFEPQNNDYVFYDTVLHSNVDGTVRDELFYQDGQPRKLKRNEVPLLAGHLPWEMGNDATGFKQVRWKYAGDGVPGSGIGVKYDGKILPQGTTLSVPDTNAVSADGYVYVSIDDKDSGWGENYTPSEDEIKAYFNGWKIYNSDVTTAENARQNGSYNGTGTRAWVSLTGVIETVSLATAISRTPNGFTPYRLIYQLAQPVEVPVTSEGKITLHEGTNVLEVGTGVVRRESVTAKYTANEVLNFNHKSYPETKFSYPAEKVLRLYANEILQQFTVGTPLDTYYGRGEWVGINQPTAKGLSEKNAYSVTYLVLDRYAFTAPLIDLQGEYRTKLAAVVAEMAQDQADIATRVSVVETQYARKQQGQWIPVVLMNGWVTFEGYHPSYYKDEFSSVRLQGIIKSGATSQGIVFLRLPKGYRPKYRKLFGSHSNETFTRIAIDPSGEVSIDLQTTPNNAALSLDMITFRAEQ